MGLEGVGAGERSRLFHFQWTSARSLGMQVKEVYPMSGEVRQFKRRDLRRGTTTCAGAGLAICDRQSPALSMVGGGLPGPRLLGADRGPVLLSAAQARRRAGWRSTATTCTCSSSGESGGAGTWEHARSAWFARSRRAGPAWYHVPSTHAWPPGVLSCGWVGKRASAPAAVAERPVTDNASRRGRPCQQSPSFTGTRRSAGRARTTSGWWARTSCKSRAC